MESYNVNLEFDGFGLEGLVQHGWAPDLSPIVERVRTNIRRKPSSFARFGKEGKFRIKINWPTDNDQAFLSLLAASLGDTTGNAILQPSTIAAPKTIKVRHPASRLAYQYDLACVEDIRISATPRALTTLELSFVHGDVNKIAYDDVPASNNITPSTGVQSFVSLGGIFPENVFDVGLRLSRPIILAGVNESGIATRANAGAWNFEFQVGLRFKDDTYFELGRDGGITDVITTIGLTEISIPDCHYRSNSPDFENKEGAVLRMFLQPTNGVYFSQL